MSSKPETILIRYHGIIFIFDDSPNAKCKLQNNIGLDQGTGNSHNNSQMDDG